MKTTKYFSIAVFLAVALLCLASLADAARESCVECHTNPKFTKTDKNVLTQCLACHGAAGHPLKEEAVKDYLSRFGASVADAAEPVSGDKKITAGKKADTSSMIFVSEGEFLMGSDDRLRDEKPAHVVYIGAFYIDRYEVTNSDYKKFVALTGHRAPDHWDGGRIPKGKESHPVVFVDWHDADEYCRSLGKRLPREREWEKAARGTDGRTFPWGSVWDMTKSNNPLAGFEDTRPIGMYPQGRSPLGLFDVSGNVWEWVDDEYRPHPGSDYVSPEFFQYKIAKGGSWWDCMFYGCGISAPTFNRSFLVSKTRNDSYGFRCAADADEKNRGVKDADKQ
ncbi:MAG: formylglycine-generating enzyme family protein [Deltaproteobacteria bacterium]|nr:formylglycine-generating enzyme family protein [Deltaproteobacteria bacterium]